MQVTSEGPTKITKATIEALWRRRQAGCRLVVRDTDCRGLTLTVNATSMTWSYAYRPRGTDPITGKRWPNRTVTLGNPASSSPDDARIQANRIKGQTAAGADPVVEKKARAATEQRKRGATLGRLLEDYAHILPKRPKMRGVGAPSARYVAEELAQTRMALADMNAEKKPVSELTDRDIRGLLSAAVGITTARHRFGPLSRFLDWCQDVGHITVNPCNQIARSRRPKTPQAREHYLTVTQLARLWHAADRLGEPVWRDLVRLLIAVPSRRGEAARLQWSHLDFAVAEWRQPGKMTKNGEPHRLYLHPLAMEILERRWQASTTAVANGDTQKSARNVTAGPARSGLVFPAPLSGHPVDTFSDIKASLIEATKSHDGTQGNELAGWTWHDFRRSFATALGEAGIPEVVADAMLNHRQAATRGGVLGVYQRAVRWPEQKRAMELWGQLLADALHGNEADAKPVPPPVDTDQGPHAVDPGRYGSAGNESGTM